MATRHSSIIIQFKKAPFVLFRDTPVERLTTNRIVIHIQPDEGITLHFGAKIPGPIVNIGAVDMDFQLSRPFWRTGQHRLRTPAVRLHDRRRDAVPACRYGRGKLEDRDADHRCLEALFRRAIFRITPPVRGARRTPTHCSKPTAEHGRIPYRSSRRNDDARDDGSPKM